MASFLRRGCAAAFLVLHALPAVAQQPSATAAVPAPSPAAAQTAAAQTPSSAGPQIATPPLQPEPPLPNRLDDVLPPWLRLRGELRERMEGFDGAGFDDSRDDLYWLTRVRVNATVVASKQLSFQAQVQDARVARKTIGPRGAPFSAPFDLRAGFAEIGAATGPVTVRVGRQELAYGEQRLVGHVGWINAARTFDGIKATVRTSTVALDVFGSSVVRTLVDEFDKSGAGNRFAGAYATTAKLLPQATVEPYLFWKRDVGLPGELGGVADLEHATVGLRVAGRLPASLDYGIEMALQRGSLGAEDVRAWAGHWQLRKSLPGPGAGKANAEYNFASGDEDPVDGVRGTFDQLYPTPHDKTGLSDQIGWKNIHHARAGVELMAFTGMPLTVNYHSWWLAESRDAAYAVNNAIVARAPAGAAGRHIGHELDVQLSRAITPQLQVAAGYAHLFPGAFLKELTPGASYRHPYVMVTYVLFAKR